MPLTTGTLLGPYEILSPIGAGGMGEVYRARDTRLDRTVAIKILPEHLAADPDLRERFEREARAISSLNHPHICTLHDVGVAQLPSQAPATSHVTIRFLVMEHLAGETLSDRIARSPLAIDEALRCAIQIADALDKAHRHGVVHRDLKPGNIMLTASGAKLLDFGLAKTGGAQAFRPAGSVTPAGVAMAATALPTTPPLTMAGTILGTLQYMSPEQLEGKDADARTDIFAFGALLYEMMTGRRAFEGKSQVSLIAAIVDHDPPSISSVRPVAPPLLDHLVKTCLAKNPDERWQSMGDVLIQLRLIAAGGALAGAPAATSGNRGWRYATWAGIVALVVVSALLTAALVRGRQEPDAKRVTFEVPTPSATSPLHIALSPDGTHLVSIVTSDKGVASLWLRALEHVSPQILAGSEGTGAGAGTAFPFWSPDSRFIGFFAGGTLKKVDIVGSPTQTLCDAAQGYGGAWNGDGVIVFAPSPSGPLFRVSASGGAPAQVTELDRARDETAHRHPSFLPDGKHFLYVAVSSKAENSAIYVGALDSKQRTRLMSSAMKAVFAPPDHVLFMRENTLMAQRLDVRRFELRGDPFPVADQVGVNLSNSAAGFTVSDHGTLALRMGLQAVGESQMIWLDRAGKQTGTISGAARYREPVLSPDGQRVAATRFESTAVGSAGDIWTLDLTRGASSRFTFDPAPDAAALWSPDGTRIVFASTRNGGISNLYQKNSGGVGVEEMLLKSDHAKIPEDWSLDGRFLLYRDTDPKTRFDLWVVPLAGDKKPQPVIHTPFNEFQGRFSADGRWIAYVSDETGRNDVYVQSFPVSESKFQISTAGGYQPRWRHDGKELFFLTAARQVMATTITVTGDGVFTAGVPHSLFTANPVTLTIDRNSWDATPDGQRFLINSTGQQSSIGPITVVLNWLSGTQSRTSR